MSHVAFKQVDVFTQVPYRGNPVAVVLDAQGLAWLGLREHAGIGRGPCRQDPCGVRRQRGDPGRWPVGHLHQRNHCLARIGRRLKQPHVPVP